jgi:hypothetical protein
VRTHASSADRLRRLSRFAAVAAGLAFGAYLVFVAAPTKGTFAIDLLCYYHVNLADPYVTPWGNCAVAVPPFGYGPPFALLLAPFTLLPWPVFVAGWYGLLLAALIYLGGGRLRETLMLAAFPPVALNFADGNIHLFMAAAVVIGFRYPAAWAFMLLTKVTPGIGLLWFVARREWRNLAIASGATAGIVLVTIILMPGQWLGWLGMLRESAGMQQPWPALPIPLWLRLPVAAAVVWWGARRDARWTAAIAVTLAIPALWLAGLAILAACWPLRRRAPQSDAASRPLQEANNGPAHRATGTAADRATPTAAT